MTRAWAFVLVLACASAREAAADDHVLLIGGGYAPEASQAQIELNVRWLQKLLAERRPDAALETYFNVGPGHPEVRDVVIGSADTGTVSEPLARVFGVGARHALRFYPSNVPGLSGGTDKATLVARLAALFGSLAPGDGLLFVYNGHGSGDPEDAGNNALRLWGDQPLSARELGGLLDRIPAGTRARLFFPQCYSGGFQRVIRPEGKDTREVIAADRCAFFSQDELLEAEGCTPSIDVGEYRDYSTYFFSALSGQTRIGAPLAFDPDRNHDGKVTLREAHFYSLVAADSVDLPSSTSEAFLERWRPWYLRWTASGPRPDNVYSALADELAARLFVEPGADAAVRAREARAEAAGQHAKIAQTRADLAGQIAALARPIRFALEERWPGLMRPYTHAFAQAYASDFARANLFVSRQPGYAELVAKQDEDRRLELEDLAVRRRAANLDRYLRLRDLARALRAFEAVASSTDRAAHARLVACEDSPL